MGSKPQQETRASTRSSTESPPLSQTSWLSLSLPLLSLYCPLFCVSQSDADIGIKKLNTSTEKSVSSQAVAVDSPV
jgi:hypothetical protein